MLRGSRPAVAGFWCRPTTANTGEIVRTNMKRVCGFAVSHTVTHYYDASHPVAWSVGLSVSLSFCHASEHCKNG